jgi:hypothetical protein
VNIESNAQNFNTLKIGAANTTVTVHLPHHPIRILGVWFKALKGTSHVKEQVKQEINHIANIINRKNITHVQAVYINNVVLILRLEYRLKSTI